MIDENGYDWRRGEPAKYELESGGWRYGGYRDSPDASSNRHVFVAGETTFRPDEWWAPCNADGSPRPWPEAKPQMLALEWRRGKIDKETWETGCWKYGSTGRTPAPGTSVWPNASWEEGADEEWWAPVHEDGSPRPWPESSSAEPTDLEWRRGTIPEAVWKTGWWRYGTTNEEPSRGVRLYGPEEYTDPRPLEWWAPVNSDGSPRPWPEESSSPAEPQPAPKPGTGDMAGQLIDLLQERRRLGIERYGTPLQAGNGRRALVDLRDELLDAVLYCQQEIEERRALQEQVKRFGDVAVQVIALLEKRKRLGIDDVVTVVQMLRGVVSAGVEPSGIQPPWPREADNIASYEELDARVVELEALLEQSVKDCSGLLERNKNLEEEMRSMISLPAPLEEIECRECHTRPPWRCKPGCSTQALDGSGHEQCRNAVRKESRRLESELREAARAIEVEQSRYHKARRDWDNENAQAWEYYDEAAAAAVELVDALDAGRAPRPFAVNLARELRR